MPATVTLTAPPAAAIHRPAPRSHSSDTSLKPAASPRRPMMLGSSSFQGSYPGTARSTGLFSLADGHDGDDGNGTDDEEDALSEGEDLYLLEKRRLMARGTISSSLPNIFETPRKRRGFHALRDGLLTPDDSPDHESGLSGAQTPTPGCLQSSSLSETNLAYPDVFEDHSQVEASTTPVNPFKPDEYGLPPIFAPGSIIHFPSSTLDSPSSAFEFGRSASSSGYGPFPPLNFPLTPVGSRSGDFVYSPQPPISSYLSSQCPTPLTQAFSTFSFSPRSEIDEYQPPWVGSPPLSSASGSEQPAFGLGLSMGLPPPPQPPLPFPLPLFYEQGGQQTPPQGRGDESRYLILWGLPASIDVESLKMQLKALGDLRAILVRFLASHGVIVLAYWDVRHAVGALKALQQRPLAYADGSVVQCAFVSRRDVEKLVADGPEGRKLLLVNEGGLVITLTDGRGGLTSSRLRVNLGGYGDLQSLCAVEASPMTFIAEFFDSRAASRARAALHNKLLDGSLLHVSPLTAGNNDVTPPLGSSSDNAPLDRHVDFVDRGKSGSYAAPSWMESSQSLSTSQSLASADVIFTSDITPSTTDSPLSTSAAGGRPAPPPTAKGIPSLLKSESVPQANRVDLARLAHGLETRTTVMLKDVPCKLTRSMLLTILHSAVKPGEVDFCYLRFDFQNACNVGYAFVNFTSTAALLRFAQAKQGKRWNLFSSEKLLQLAYANIQSKKALVRKFINSGVMLQPEEYRPIIFYSSGPLRGQREPFPPPTDLHRRENSLRSTQTLGLYHNSPPVRAYPALPRA